MKGRILGDPPSRKLTALEQLIADEQADIEAERRRQEFAQEQGRAMQSRGTDKEPRKQ